MSSRDVSSLKIAAKLAIAASLTGVFIYLLSVHIAPNLPIKPAKITQSVSTLDCSKKSTQIAEAEIYPPDSCLFVGCSGFFQ